MKKYFFLLIVCALFYTKHQIPTNEVPSTIHYNSSWYTTLHFPSNWKQNYKLYRIRLWFDSHPELARLKYETKFNIYEEGTEVFQKHYEGKVTVPSILIQRPDGSIIFAATANNLPVSPEELISKINKKIQPTAGKCNDPNCPKCYPKPEPEPILKPIPKPKTDYTKYIIAVLVGAGAGLLKPEGKDA